MFLVCLLVLAAFRRILLHYILIPFFWITVNVISLISVIIYTVSLLSVSSLGHQELWESVDPSAAALPSRRGGHEDLPHTVRVPGPAGLQELHPPHHPTGNGHPPAKRQPQQSIGYHTCMHTLQVFFPYRSSHLTHSILPYHTSWLHVTLHYMTPNLSSAVCQRPPYPPVHKIFRICRQTRKWFQDCKNATTWLTDDDVWGCCYVVLGTSEVLLTRNV